MRKQLPTVALLYDFDNTLCTKDMQEYGFIPSLDISAKEFWSQSNSLAKEEKMDRILACMYQMVRQARAKRLPIRRETFVGLGEAVDFFPGVEQWFERINAYALSCGMRAEHFIISSGLKEIIEGCSLASAFKEIYACEFHYDENGVADWPKNVVNYTAKTQFLFRINKGVLDISDDESLNEYRDQEERPVPFRNMLYFGDGMTDVPCMKLVKLNGGKSIAVYKNRQKFKAAKLLKDDRVDFIAYADYTQGSELDILVKDIIGKIAADDKLAQLTRRQKKNCG